MHAGYRERKMSTSNSERPLHLLSLDGGGVRGLSSIMILRHIMENVSKKRGRTVQPWEEFDMIAGTSTGGLIAIMLGRLRMSLEDCEDAYLNISQQIFTPRRSKFNLLRSKDFLLADGKFDYKIFEKAIKDIISQSPGFDETSLLKDPKPNPQCRVFVCATRTGDTSAAILRSYDTTRAKFVYDECKIWQACRATSAATTFFDPIKIGKFDQKFADGGILYNNPIQVVQREASDIWPDRIDGAVLLSIGTGSAPGGTFEGNLKKIVDGMKEIVTQTERTYNDFFLAHKIMVDQNRLFRFDVYHGLADVGLEEWREKAKMANATQTYLDQGEVSRRANLCVEQLCRLKLPETPTGQDQKSPSLNLGTSPQVPDPKQEQDLSDCIRSLSFKRMDSRRNIISLAHQDTCEWLLKTQSFENWGERADIQNNNAVLWIKGHPGVGKSTLMKHILLYCEKTFQDHSIAFFFFNARGVALERCPEGMLRSLMVQLLEQNPYLQGKFLFQFRKKNMRHHKTKWETGELKEFILREYKNHQDTDTLFLIDALDECNDSDVQEVVDFLEDLSESAIQSNSVLRICLSSRHYPHIDMKKKIELVVEQHAGHDRDISKYVRSKLNTSNEDIQHQILNKANHIFIWVVLVVEILNKEFRKGNEKAMWKKLDELPSNLDELFSSLLEKENSEDEKKKSVLLFQWVLFPRIPLSPEALYFAVLAGTEPEGLSAWDPSQVSSQTIKRFINSTSKGLVEITSKRLETNEQHKNIQWSVDDSLYVQFIHQSVIDFLTRNQRLAKLDPTLSPNAIGASHDRLVSCCMSYLMQRDLRSLMNDAKSKPRVAIQKIKLYPFIKYATKNLLYHAENAQEENVSQMSLLKRLNADENYNIFQVLRDAAFQSLEEPFYQEAQLLYVLCVEGRFSLAQIFLEDDSVDVNILGGYYGTPLCAAVMCDFTDVVVLLLNHNADPNLQGNIDMNALQEAAYFGFKDVVALLIEHGADVNARGKYGTTLQSAVASGQKDIAAFLIEHGADVNAAGNEYGTALQSAVKNGKKDIVALLLEHGADVNARGKYGTALQLAAIGGQKDIVALLLEHGADVNAESGFFGTALEAARNPYRSKHSKDIVAMLLEHGAI